MAYTRVSLDKQEKTGIAVAFFVILIKQLNDFIPNIRNFWDGIDERVAPAVDNLSLVALGYVVLKVSKMIGKSKGFMVASVVGMVVGYVLIAVGVAGTFGINLYDTIMGNND
jgi:hypothetical protein